MKKLIRWIALMMIAVMACGCVTAMAAGAETGVFLANEDEVMAYVAGMLKDEAFGWGDSVDDMVLVCIQTTDTQYYVYGGEKTEDEDVLFTCIVVNNGELAYLNDNSRTFEPVGVDFYLARSEELLPEEKANEICGEYAAYFAGISPERVGDPESYEYRGLWMNLETGKVYADFMQKVDGKWNLDRSFILEVDGEELRVVDFAMEASNG